ncbi:MAG: Type 1 glutamine amidotransferase-like domain-containing protein [Treponema sp.]|nr:Type 1 glutamine amidotransferase-like domain-containing protein [Treponema sp.]
MKKVAFIPTASIHEGYTGYVGSAKKLFKKMGASLTEINIAKEAYSTIKSVFLDVDIIYSCGGFNTPTPLETSLRSCVVKKGIEPDCDTV